MFCQRCGRQIPDGVVFCNFCGAQQGVVGQPPTPFPPAPGPPTQPAPAPAPVAPPQPPAQPTLQIIAPPGATELKCSSCGAPIKPEGGLTVITCEYCGTAASLGTGGWSIVQKHVMLLNGIDQHAALQSGGKWLDQGILRRNVAKKSEFLEVTLRYVPYWIVPTGVTADFTGIRWRTTTRRGPDGTTVQERYAIPVRDRISNFFYIPVVAVGGYTKYQPDDGYQFSMEGKMPFDRKRTGGVEVLNGDVMEQEAAQFAQSLAEKFVRKQATSGVDDLESFVPHFQQSSGELLHAPVWFVQYRYKGVKEMFILIDGSASRVIDGERPKVSLW